MSTVRGYVHGDVGRGMGRSKKKPLYVKCAKIILANEVFLQDQQSYFPSINRSLFMHRRRSGTTRTLDRSLRIMLVCFDIYHAMVSSWAITGSNLVIYSDCAARSEAGIRL